MKRILVLQEFRNVIVHRSGKWPKSQQDQRTKQLLETYKGKLSLPESSDSLPAAVWYSEGSPGEAAEVLAKTAFEVSKFVLRNGPPARDKDGQEIRDMKDYLYRGYMKKANHRFRIETTIDAAVVSLDPERDISDDGSSKRMMENDVLFRELYSQMEPKLKVMFYWREIKGCRWRQVGKIVGMKPHAAKVYYYRGIEQLAKLVYEGSNVVSISKTRNKGKASNQP